VPERDRVVRAHKLERGRQERGRLEVEVHSTERRADGLTRRDTRLELGPVVPADVLLLVEPRSLLVGNPSLDDFLEPALREALAARAVAPEDFAGAEPDHELPALLVLSVGAEDRAARSVAPDVDQGDLVPLPLEKARPKLKRLGQVLEEPRREGGLVECPRVDVVEVAGWLPVAVDAGDDVAAPNLHRAEIKDELD
jgi:hypothetical protein